MKTKLVVLSCAVASLASFSFTSQNNSREELFNHINSDKSSNPSDFKGTAIFQTLLLPGNSFTISTTENIVVTNDSQPQEPPKDQLPKELKRIIKKYN